MTQPYSAASSPYVPDPTAYAPKVKLPTLKRGRLLFAGSTGILDATPSVAVLATFTSGLPLPVAMLQESLYMSGACPMLYDGVRVHEAGFNYYPEASYLSDTNSSGILTAGSISFVFVYEWLDSKGKLHRSALSNIVTHVVVNDTVTFKIAPMFLTDKQGADGTTGAYAPRESIKLVCYRTAVAGSVFYRDSAISLAFNDNRVSDGTAGRSDVYVSSSVLDTALVNAEPLYATAALQNQAFNATSVCCMHQRRLFSVKQEDQNFLRYTDAADDRFIAVGSNEIYEIPVPEDGGSVVSLASMDDKLIIFCQHRIYYIFGEGPDRLGAQNGYSLPQLCSAKMGATGGCQEALALTPEGLWFLSSTGGLRLLTRGLNIAADEHGSYLGTEADGMVPTTITRIQSASIDAKNQVRWYLSNGTVVVWDYQQRQWSKATNHTSTGGVVSARGLFWHSDGTLLLSSNSAAGGLDDATTTTQVVETAWIATADVQGFQRIYKLLLLGQAMSACTVDVAVGYDYDEAWIDGSTAQQGSGIAGTALVYTGLSGAFAINDVITGGTSNATGTVAYAASSVVVLTNISGTFQVAEVIESDSASTATTIAVQANVIAASGLPVAPLAGQTVTGATSGATGTIVTVTVSGSSYLLSLTSVTGSFVAELIRISKLFSYTVSGAVNPLQLEHPMHKQQCESVRFRITITPGSSAEAVRLTNFGLTVGLKKGTHKFASSKRF